ncbi:MAG: pyruvate carboxyltransferase [Lachnospiraceae bacterium]|nr:pyruvate carboxyltransferase [Lachnospiraceae bacterium]
MNLNEKPWQQEKWYTSPWNFAQEATEGFDLGKKIKFHDVTLRDGEQQAGLVFTKDQKIALADKMAEMGIQRIEAGMPAVSAQDREAIIEIAKRHQGPGSPEIFAFARCMKQDVLRAADCGVRGVVIEIPASEHLVKNAYKWEYEKAIELAIEATQCARENGLYTVFFTIDGTRTEMDTFFNLITRVANEGHMDALAVVDTMGGLAPHACSYLIKQIKKVIDKPLEVHFHDDYGLGAANTLMALSAGAEVAHTTISGIGERAGNAAYEDIALSLLTMYGIDTGLKYEKMYELSEMMRKYTGHQIPSNRGIVGPTLAQIESGIVADWYINANKDHPLELSPYDYSLVGHPDAEVVIGKMSGIPTVDIYLDKLGMECKNKEQKLEIVSYIKEKSFEKHGLLTIGEFTDIAHKVLD